MGLSALCNIIVIFLLTDRNSRSERLFRPAAAHDITQEILVEAEFPVAFQADIHVCLRRASGGAARRQKVSEYLAHPDALPLGIYDFHVDIALSVVSGETFIPVQAQLVFRADLPDGGRQPFSGSFLDGEVVAGTALATEAP